MAARKSRTRETGGAASATLERPERSGRRPPAKSMQDWKREEQVETETRSVNGEMDGSLITPEAMVAGSNYSVSNYSRGGWPFSTSFYFPGQRVAIDYPETAEEAEAKAKFFAEEKIPYLAVLPGKALKIQEARQALRALGAKLEG